MRLFALTACLAAACPSVVSAEGATSPFTHAPRTLVCSFTELRIGWGTSQGGVFVVTNGAAALINASAARGIVRRIDRYCKRIRTRTLPRPTLPLPNYPMAPGAGYECSSRGPVLIHARFLRTAGRLTGLYVSVRERRTGRFIAGGLFTLRGAREYIGPTCVGR